MANILGTETILIVEDELAVRLLTRVILERAGYRAYDAANPAEAEAVFEEHADAIGMLITDVVMPGSSGPALYQRLAMRRTRLKVLYMSGYSNEAIAQTGGLDSGALVAFIDKPFTAHTLTRKVREVLDG